MHSSRMRTARSSPYGGSLSGDGSSSQRPLCTKTHLDRHPGRNMGLDSHTGSDITQRPLPCEQNDWHMPVKILPCPKPRLWVVIRTGFWPDSHTGSDITQRLLPCEQNDWHMPVKILPCPKLRFAGGNKNRILTIFTFRLRYLPVAKTYFTLGLLQTV